MKTTLSIETHRSVRSIDSGNVVTFEHDGDHDLNNRYVFVTVNDVVVRLFLPDFLAVADALRNVRGVRGA